jgi:hypothetical protein
MAGLDPAIHFETDIVLPWMAGSVAGHNILIWDDSWKAARKLSAIVVGQGGINECAFGVFQR